MYRAQWRMLNKLDKYIPLWLVFLAATVMILLSLR